MKPAPPNLALLQRLLELGQQGGDAAAAVDQGRTLVHFSAQREHILWVRWVHGIPPVY